MAYLISHINQKSPICEMISRILSLIFPCLFQQTSIVRMRIRQQTSVLLNLLGHIFTALLLALAGIALPSLLSATYFLSFLVIATWWGCYRSLGNRFAVFRIVLLVYSALHLVLLYLYQFQFFQEALDPANFYARYVKIFLFSCGKI